MDITPKDQTETKALGLGQRITVALGIVITAAGTLLAAIGGLDWITSNLPLLGTGLASLVTGGITAFVAVRRMRSDKLAGKAGLLLLLLLPLFLLSGCAVVSGKAGDSHYTGLAFGEKASSTLAGLNVTETTTEEGQVVTDRGVGIDSAGASGEADLGKIIGNLLLLGLQSQGVPVKATAAASAATSDVSETDTEPAEESAAVAYSTDGYGGTPGAAGEGVYGRPSCARCRAYKAAHADVEIINLDEGTHRSDMWAALRLRGYTGGSAALPVLITADAYTLSAK